MKKILSIISILALSLILSSCAKNIKLKDQNISHETKFGGIYIEITIDDFNSKGFAYGDSVEITFTNGYKLEDLPYYNGYYTNTGEALLVGYPGYPYIRVGINNGADLWTIADLKDTDKATITLREKGKYLDMQEAMDIHYTDIQGDMPDEKFGNFRVVNVGNLKENILYRSASPADNQHNRASVVDRLITNKVNTIINLSDTDSELLAHTTKEDFNSPYFKTLYDRGDVIALAMNMNFTAGEAIDRTPTFYMEYLNESFQDKLIRGLRFMLNHEGPYLVHCVEGKDRTGFVCMVIEALGGASYNEIITDYMITYDNYYDINLESDPTKYNIIKTKNIDEMCKTIINDQKVDITTADYSYYIEEYLVSKGMERSEVIALKALLNK